MSEQILAFDMSYTTTGWVLIHQSKIVRMGSFPLKGKCRGEKLNQFFKQICKLIVNLEPDIIACEDIYFSKFTAYSYLPLAKLQGFMEMACYRLNRSEPLMARASEVRASFDIDPRKMKREFDKQAKKEKHHKLSKAKRKALYDDFKKNWLVDFVNERYPKLLDYSQHDIADAILLGLHIEKEFVE